MRQKLLAEKSTENFRKKFFSRAGEKIVHKESPVPEICPPYTCSHPDSKKVRYILNFKNWFKMKVCIRIFNINKFWAKMKNLKKFHENLLKFWNWSGAKDCKSCSPRKMLQNAYLGAKIGFDAEENEPSKVCWFSLKNTELYGIESFN